MEAVLSRYIRKWIVGCCDGVYHSTLSLPARAPLLFVLLIVMEIPLSCSFLLSWIKSCVGFMLIKSCYQLAKLNGNLFYLKADSTTLTATELGSNKC